MSPQTRAEQKAAHRARHEERQRLARELALPHGGVVTRAMLLGAGLTRGQIAAEIDRGAWHAVGRHTVSVEGRRLSLQACWCRAVWESGCHAALDGTSALVASGLRGWKDEVVHVSVPNNARVRLVAGVRHHRLRSMGVVLPNAPRRVESASAVIRAAQWMRSDRAAATIVAMTVQQRLVRAETLLSRWDAVGYAARRTCLDGVIRDVCLGAESLAEIDFARLCRARGLPEPTRQHVIRTAQGRLYLDVYWEELGVHVEINGAQHSQGTATIDDALRQNTIQLGKRNVVSLQIPVIGLRVCPDAFMDQVAGALADAARRVAS